MAGNPTSFKGTAKTYDANNQQTTTGYVYYDSNGTPTIYKGTTLSFDAENRLTAHGASLTAGYRGDGLRAWKETAGGRTYFLYDGTTPIIELEASGAHTATNTFGAHGLVSRYRNSNGSRIFYTFDAQGSVAQRLDLYGNVLTSRSYTAHGQMVGKGVADPFGYKARWGYYTDTETGLLLLTHRYYDPSTGRFLTRDPIGYNGGINLYAYVRNSPSNFIDPLGLHIAGVTGSASAFAGYGPGAGATIGGLAGYNFNNRRPGAAVSGGLDVFGPHNVSGGAPAGIGAYANVGAGAFYSNASSFNDLGGNFHTIQIAAGPVGIEIDWSGSTFVIAVTGGPGAGAGIRYQRTNTPWTWESCVAVPEGAFASHQ